MNVLNACDIHHNSAIIFLNIKSAYWLKTSANRLGIDFNKYWAEYSCNVGDLGLIPGSGRPTGEGNGYQLQYSSPENFMDCAVHGVADSRT